jgi:hypothetical protein
MHSDTGEDLINWCVKSARNSLRFLEIIRNCIKIGLLVTPWLKDFKHRVITSSLFRDFISLLDSCLLAAYCGNWDIARNECVSTVPFVPLLDIPIRLAGDS